MPNVHLNGLFNVHFNTVLWHPSKLLKQHLEKIDRDTATVPHFTDVRLSSSTATWTEGHSFLFGIATGNKACSVFDIPENSYSFM
jgi:hypothetical protein